MAGSELINIAMGRYHIVELISAGGVAEVFRAEHSDDRSSMAIKVMRRERAGDKEQVRSFEAEYGFLERMDHACIPKVKRYGSVMDRPSMLMEYVPGRTLYQLKQLEERFDRVGAFIALVNVVAYIHRQQVLHNDIKLENCILQPGGRISLVDFGNARNAGGGFLSRLLRRKRQLFGTASYLAPELLQGAEPSYASDCYALGVCAHILLTGEAPFNDPRQSARLRRAVKEQAPKICDRVPRLPKQLGGLIDRCVLKDPGLRPTDAQELKTALKDHFGSGIHSSPTKLTQELNEGD
jgi:serine/threonine protein kinase